MKARAMNEIIRGAGVRGMVGGQCMDLYCEREGVMDEDMLSYIHMNKTARMLISPLCAAAELAGCKPDSPEMNALTGDRVIKLNIIMVILFGLRLNQLDIKLSEIKKYLLLRVV